MVLNTFGFTSIAPQSEHSTIPIVIYNHLKARFKNIIVFFDYDEGGLKGAEKLKEKYGMKTIFIPKHYLELYGIKDISDFRKEMGENKTKELLNEMFYENT